MARKASTNPNGGDVVQFPSNLPPGAGGVQEEVTVTGHELEVDNYRSMAGFVETITKGKGLVTIEKLKAQLKELARAALDARPGAKRVTFIGSTASIDPVKVSLPDYEKKGNRKALDADARESIAKEQLLPNLGLTGDTSALFEAELKITLTGEVAKWFLTAVYTPSYGAVGQEHKPVPEGLAVTEDLRLKSESVPVLRQLIGAPDEQVTPIQKSAARRLLELCLNSLTLK